MKKKLTKKPLDKKPNSVYDKNMKLTKKEKELLIEKALKGEVPKEIADTAEAIFEGKKTYPIHFKDIYFTDTHEKISFTDHPANQFISYLMDKFGKNFGLLYFSALQGEKFYKRIEKTYRKNKWPK